MLATGLTGVSGFICDPNRQHFCLSSITSSQTVTFDNKFICNSTDSLRGTGSWILPPSILARITAAQIVYIQTSTDPKSPIASSNGNGTSPSSGGGDINRPLETSEKGQLSAGAKAGIAISVALASIFAALSGYLLYSRKKRRRQTFTEDTETEQTAAETRSEATIPAQPPHEDPPIFSAVSPETTWSEVATIITRGSPSDIESLGILDRKPALSPELWRHPALRADSRAELSDGPEVALSELPGDEVWRT